MPRVIFALQRLQTVSTHVGIAQTQLCFKGDNLRPWNLLTLKFAHSHDGERAKKQSKGKYFPVYSIFSLRMLLFHFSVLNVNTKAVFNMSQVGSF